MWLSNGMATKWFGSGTFGTFGFGMWLRVGLTLGVLFSLLPKLSAITRSGKCESFASVKPRSQVFFLSGSILYFMPDRDPNSPFAVFANHTAYGYCLKIHLEWLPNYINLTLVCDCPESSTHPVLVADILPDQQNVSLPLQPWSTIQLVYAVRNKYAIVYGCRDHGNDTVSEGIISFGRTLRNFEEYKSMHHSAIYASFWTYHKLLLANTQRYIMNHSKALGCNFRHEFYLYRGLTKSDIAFTVVIGIMAITVVLSLCARFCFTYMRAICKDL